MYLEAQIVDLPDEALKTLITYLWEAAKRMDEELEADGHIQKVSAELKHYKKEKYLDPKRAYKAKLRAARYLAQARGITFQLPEEIQRGD